LTLATAKDYVRRAEEESDAIDALPPGQDRDERLQRLMEWLDTKFLQIPEDLRREALR
jgi:hypothetical protein